MYHFVTLLWNAEDLTARDAAAHLGQKLRQSSVPWECHLSAEGMSVFSLPPPDPALRPYVLAGQAGVVLGRLFRADLSNPHLGGERDLDESATTQISRSAGQHLIRNFWGGYVAFFRDREGRGAYAIRDCSGKIPCYYVQPGGRFSGITIVFADVSDLALLELPALTIDWEYLAAFIHSSQLQVRSCAFKEVKELLAGDCLEVRGRGVGQTAIWDPPSVCRRRCIDNYDDAVAELRYVAQRCIDAWAQVYDPILHSLSGGFDSSAVLGCLSKSAAHAKITCVNQYAQDANGDERRYARLAAARAGVMLVELPMDSSAGRFDARLLSGPKTLKPSVAALCRLLEIELINRIATTTGAHALWTGQGGDHIFLQMTNSLSAADFLAIRGFRSGLIAAVRDAARLSRQPYWFVLKGAFEGWGGRRKPAPDAGRTLGTAPQVCFINPAALPDHLDGYVAHPWAADTEDLPKGKGWQIRFLAEVINRHRPIPRMERAPQHHPLLSQPLVEVCLQIPTYHLVRGGRERGLARDAFSDRVPVEINRRRDKGSVKSHTTEALRQSETFVRELLLEGLLVGEGVLVRSELEPYIVHGQPFREEHFLPLLASIAAEVWVRTCSRSIVAAAA